MPPPDDEYGKSWKETEGTGINTNTNGEKQNGRFVRFGLVVGDPKTNEWVALQQEYASEGAYENEIDIKRGKKGQWGRSEQVWGLIPDGEFKYTATEVDQTRSSEARTLTYSFSRTIPKIIETFYRRKW